MTMMKVGIASDHAAFQLKKSLKFNLKEINWVDFGCHSEDSIDYPDIVPDLCKELLSRKLDFGILLCGTGVGVSIAANRLKGIRAALCCDKFTTKMSRKHNNANILAMGARVISYKNAISLFKIFISTPYEHGRHQNRIKKIDSMATTN